MRDWTNDILWKLPERSSVAAVGAVGNVACWGLGALGKTVESASATVESASVETTRGLQTGTPF